MSPLSCSQTFTLLRLGFSRAKIIGGPLLCCVSKRTSRAPANDVVVEWPVESWNYCEDKVHLNSSPLTMLSKTTMSQYIHACSDGFSSCCMREIHSPFTSGGNRELKFHGIT